MHCHESEELPSGGGNKNQLRKAVTEDLLSIRRAAAARVVSFWSKGRINNSESDGDGNGDFYKR